MPPRASTSGGGAAAASAKKLSPVELKLLNAGLAAKGGVSRGVSTSSTRVPGALTRRRGSRGERADEIRFPTGNAAKRLVRRVRTRRDGDDDGRSERSLAKGTRRVHEATRRVSQLTDTSLQGLAQMLRTPSGQTMFRFLGKEEAKAYVSPFRDGLRAERPFR